MIETFDILRAITLWQPWASLWALRAKMFETRSWSTSYRGPIAIHAAKKDPYAALDGVSTDIRASMLVALRETGACPFGKAFKDLPLGSIIATAELVGCHRMDIFRNSIRTEQGIYIPTSNELLFGDWTPGRYAWEITNVKVLEQPIKMRGSQGLWTVHEPEQVLKGA